MLPFLFLIGLPVSPVAAEPRELRQQLRARYGRNLRAVRETRDAVLKKHLPRHAIYEVNVFNPASMLAGRPEHHRIALVERGSGKIQILERQLEVLALLGGIALSARDDALALEAMRLYAGLRRIRPVSSAAELAAACPSFARGPRQAGEAAIRAPAIARRAAGVTVTFHAVLDPFICGVGRVELTLLSTGRPTASERILSSRSGYD